MTQIERIIKEGIVSKNFLKEETVCDFHITEQIKKIQAISLDMLIKFDDVCKRNNLKYYLAFGSLIGAIRHKGFIPWDVDIDVLMPREDYEKLSIMTEAFEYPYFLQTPETDKGYLGAITRIRNSETCAFHHYWGATGYNNGLWIDIFPLDKCMPEDREEMFKQIDFYNSYNSAFMKIAGNNVNEKGRKILLNNLDLSPKESVARIKKLATKYRYSETKYVTLYVMTGFLSYEYYMWEKDDFAETIDLDFCGYKFPGPIGFDRLLKKIYGNYMELPPIDQRERAHQWVDIDTDKSYLEVFKEKGICRV